MQNLKFAFSSIMAHKMRSFLTMIGIIIGVCLSSSSWLWETPCLVRSLKHDQITEGYPCIFLLIKSKDGLTQRQSALTVSGEEEDVHVGTTKTTRNPGQGGQAKLKGVDSYYVTNSTNVILSL